jgi:hypothetical protein
VSGPTRVELHSRECSCRGGSWALLGDAGAAPCTGPKAQAAERLRLSLDEWKQLGKPACVEAAREAMARADAGERRQFERFEVRLPVRLARIPTWRDPSSQSEDTQTEVVAAGGALVCSRMAVERGEVLRFVLDGYETRAEVTYVSSGVGAGLDGVQRLGLKFLDAPLPDSFIPPGSRPLPSTP